MVARDSSFYDDHFRRVEKHRVPPRDSLYYPLWRAVFARADENSIIERYGPLLQVKTIEVVPHYPDEKIKFNV